LVNKVIKLYNWCWCAGGLSRCRALEALARKAFPNAEKEAGAAAANEPVSAPPPNKSRRDRTVGRGYSRRRAGGDMDLHR
jgi:hypothetical protein